MYFTSYYFDYARTGSPMRCRDISLGSKAKINKKFNGVWYTYLAKAEINNC